MSSIVADLWAVSKKPAAAKKKFSRAVISDDDEEGGDAEPTVSAPGMPLAGAVDAIADEGADSDDGADDEV